MPSKNVRLDRFTCSGSSPSVCLSFFLDRPGPSILLRFGVWPEASCSDGRNFPRICGYRCVLACSSVQKEGRRPCMITREVLDASCENEVPIRIMTSALIGNTCRGCFFLDLHWLSLEAYTVISPLVNDSFYSKIVRAMKALGRDVTSCIRSEFHLQDLRIKHRWWEKNQTLTVWRIWFRSHKRYILQRHSNLFDVPT